MDYVPARSWLILFSHHFASIAGAGPIVGPVIAVAIWGWWPALVWIVVGTVFMGGVHDFASLIISIRHKARSIADIAAVIALLAVSAGLGAAGLEDNAFKRRAWSYRCVWQRLWCVDSIRSFWQRQHGRDPDT